MGRKIDETHSNSMGHVVVIDQDTRPNSLCGRHQELAFGGAKDQAEAVKELRDRSAAD